MNKPILEETPNYALKVSASNISRIEKMLREASCGICGEPFVRAGPMCPACKEKHEAETKAMAMALASWFEKRPRLINSRSHDLIDP